MRTGGRTTLRRRALALPTLAVLILASCSGSDWGSGKAMAGRRIEVLAVWSGTEQRQFERVAAAFEERTGVAVS